MSNQEHVLAELRRLRCTRFDTAAADAKARDAAAILAAVGEQAQLSVASMAQALGVSRPTVYELIKHSQEVVEDMDLPADQRVTDTEGLKKLNRIAVRQNFNRALSKQTLAQLDPEGTHVLLRVMIHEHAAMQPVEPHFRCEILLKLKDSLRPAVTYIDIPMDSWAKLTPVEAIA